MDEIVAYKQRELEQTKRERSLQDLQSKISSIGPSRRFKEALRKNGMSLIAEVKRASPSAGIIREDFDPVEVSRIYQEHGASAISVLTESRYFQGALGFVPQIREVVSLPILRKDFIFDEYQIYESKAYGADAILLIAAILSDQKMTGLMNLAREVGLDVLVEVHSEEELKRVLATEAQIIGINNRDLKTMKVDLKTTARLAPKAIAKNQDQNRVIVSESGINTFEDVKFVREAGAHAILVGESLMRGGDIGEKVRELIGKHSDERLSSSD